MNQVSRCKYRDNPPYMQHMALFFRIYYRYFLNRLLRADDVFLYLALIPILAEKGGSLKGTLGNFQVNHLIIAYGCQEEIFSLVHILFHINSHSGGRLRERPRS